MLHAVAPCWTDVSVLHATQAAFNFLDITCFFQPLHVLLRYSCTCHHRQPSLLGFYCSCPQLSCHFFQETLLIFPLDQMPPTPPRTLSHPSHGVMLAIDFLVSLTQWKLLKRSCYILLVISICCAQMPTNHLLGFWEWHLDFSSGTPMCFVRQTLTPRFKTDTCKPGQLASSVNWPQ